MEGVAIYQSIGKLQELITTDTAETICGKQMWKVVSDGSHFNRISAVLVSLEHRVVNIHSIKWYICSKKNI